MTACLQKVLGTAGRGFIASRLIDRLLGDRYEGTAMYDLTFLETTYETDTPACILIRRFGLSDLRRLLRCLQRAEQGEKPGPGRRFSKYFVSREPWRRSETLFTSLS